MHKVRPTENKKNSAHSDTNRLVIVEQSGEADLVLERRRDSGLCAENYMLFMTVHMLQIHWRQFCTVSKCLTTCLDVRCQNPICGGYRVGERSFFRVS